MVIYADLIFLLNLMIDVAMLYMTAWCRRLRPVWWRIGLSAIIGASYVMMMLFPTLSSFYTFVLKSLFSVIMLIVAFGFRDIGFLIRNAAVFYMVNFATAGGMLGLHYLFQSSNQVLNGIVFTQSGGAAFQVQISTALIMILIVPLLWWFGRLIQSFRQRDTIQQYKVNVEVHLEDIHIQCSGFIDTGNQLYDPLTKTPVMVMEVRCWSALFSEAWLNRFENAHTDEMMKALDAEDPDWRHRLRFVPYRGIHHGTEFMMALRPDEVVITSQDQIYRTDKVFIGLRGERLSREGDYQAIVHPALVAESNRTAQFQNMANHVHMGG